MRVHLAVVGAALGLFAVCGPYALLCCCTSPARAQVPPWLRVHLVLAHHHSAGLSPAAPGAAESEMEQRDIAATAIHNGV